MIGLISQESLESKNVQRKWKWARRRNRRIFFIKLRDFDEDFLSHQFDEALYLNYSDGLSQLETELSEFAEKYDKFTESVTVKERNLNAEILKDLDTLASQASQIATRKRGKHDPIIGSDTPTAQDWALFKDRTRRYWLESLLRPTLQEAAALNIGLSTQPDMVIQHEELGEIDLSGGSMNVRGIFDALRSFLIVGDAGAGKTVMLLQLATKLLINPPRDLPNSLPLLLNLSSWGNDDIPLEEWLLKEAETTYQIRKKTFMRWLADKRLLLLLDGLDEIRTDEDDRRTLADRIQKINAYRQAHPNMPMVICTRINEYRLSTGDKAENKLNFDHAIKVDPLTEAQIQSYMDAPDLTSLRELYAEDPIVQELAKIPFLLVTMTHTYRDLPKRQLEIENNTIPDRLDHLFRKYLTKQQQSHAPLRHSEEKIRDYLTWIATKTTVFGTVFRADKVTIEWFRGDEDVAHIYRFLTRPSSYGLRFGKPPQKRRLNRKKLLRDYNQFVHKVTTHQYIKNIIARRLILTKLPRDYNQLVYDLTTRQILRPFAGGHTFRHDYLRQSFFGNSKIVMAQIYLLINEIDDSRKGKIALNALAQFGNVAIEPLIASLSYKTPDEVAKALVKIGKDAVEPLIARLDDEDSDVRSAVAEALGILRDVRAVEPLIARLNDEDDYVRVSVVRALGILRDLRAVEPLIARLNDENDYVRVSVVRALGILRDLRAVEPLIARLNDKGGFAQYEIIDTLGKLGYKQAVEPLIAYLDDEDNFVRCIIAHSLGMLGDVRAVEPLNARLNDEDWDVRHTVIWALGQIGSGRAIGPLIISLEDTSTNRWDERICDYAADALRKIGTPEALQALHDKGFEHPSPRPKRGSGF